MKAFYLLIIVLILSSCGSLHKRVYEEVRVGDKREEILEKFGEPVAFKMGSRESNLLIYTYAHKRDVCSIAFYNDEVSGVSCERTAAPSMIFLPPIYQPRY